MKIVLYPNGGLGNRMRAVDSAINLLLNRTSQTAGKTSDSLTVVWNKDSEMICGWNDVFLPVEFIKDRDINKYMRFVLRHHNNVVLSLFLRLLQKLHVFCLLDIYDGSIDYGNYYNDNYLVLVIRSCIAFCPNKRFHTEVFEVKDKDRLNRELSKVDDNTIGVHVRRTDNTLSVQHSPIELFEKRMEEEMERNHDTRFYLCSDDESVKRYFRSEKWGSLVKMPCDTLDRNSIEGVVQAACEMQALAHCKKIYGSYWSSFGGVAARMGNIKNIIVSDIE